MAVNINGTSGISGVDGSAGTPALQGTDSNTGISFGTDEVNINTGGTARATVDSSGRLLVGTSTARTAYTGILTPRLQLEGTSSETSHLMVTRNENTATPSGLVLAKSRGTSTGSNVIVQNNDAVGVVGFEGSDGVDTVRLAEIAGYVDGTPGADDMPGRLVFSTTADGASSPTERMRIQQSGTILCCGATVTNPGAGNTSTGAVFENASDGATVLISRESNIPLYLNRNSDGNITHLIRSGTTVGSISVNTSSTAYNTSSDYRLKENVTAVTDSITRLQQLKPSRFNFIADPDTTVDGFIAHEVQDVVPEAIAGEKDAVDDEGNPIYQGIDQSKLVPLLTAALQEAIAKIETLEAANASLEARLTALEGGAAQ